MKTKRFAGLILLATLLVSCGEEEEKTTFEIQGLQDYYEFMANLGQKESFEIDSYVSWEITKDNLDWLYITPFRSPGGDQKITMIPDNNNSTETRIGTFTITAAGHPSKTVTITQYGLAPVLSIEGPAMLCCNSAGLFSTASSFTVNSNCPWTVAAPSWVTLSTTSGDAGTTAVTVNVQKNEVEQARREKILIKAGELQETVYVDQEAQPSSYISVDAPSVEFINNGGSAKVNVLTNSSWTASADSWITVTPASGKNDSEVTITVGSAGKSRTGSVTFVTDKGVKTTLAIEQNCLDISGFVEYTVGSQYYWGSTAATLVASSDWTSKGVKACDNSPKKDGQALIYLEWIKADNGADYTVTYTYYNNANMRLTYIYTDDAMVFHIPVVHIDAGREIVLHYAMNLTGKKPQYWVAEYSLDGGRTWLTANTGAEYTTPGLKAYANIQVPVKSVQYDFNISCPVTQAVDFTDVLLRVRTPDGTIDINGTDPSELPASSGTATFAAPAGYDGPTIEFK